MAKKVKVWTATEEAISLAKAIMMDTGKDVHDAVDAACDHFTTADRDTVTQDVLVFARETQSAGWAAAWAANDAAFELDMKAKDKGLFDVTSEMAGFWGDEDDDSLWLADDDNPCFARSAGWMFDENDSTLEALLLDQEVIALGIVEENERD